MISENVFDVLSDSFPSLTFICVEDEVFVFQGFGDVTHLQLGRRRMVHVSFVTCEQQGHG